MIVDGIPVRDEKHVLDLLHGDDVPNSAVTLHVLKPMEKSYRSVTLRRMPSDFLQERLQLFQVFTEAGSPSALCLSHFRLPPLCVRVSVCMRQKKRECV